MSSKGIFQPSCVYFESSRFFLDFMLNQKFFFPALLYLLRCLMSSVLFSANIGPMKRTISPGFLLLEDSIASSPSPSSSQQSAAVRVNSNRNEARFFLSSIRHRECQRGVADNRRSQNRQ